MITQKIIIVDNNEIAVNCCDLSSDWLLIHNNIEVISLEDVSDKLGILETSNKVFEAATKEECLQEIKRLNLIYKEKEESPKVKKRDRNEINNLFTTLTDNK